MHTTPPGDRDVRSTDVSAQQRRERDEMRIIHEPMMQIYMKIAMLFCIIFYPCLMCFCIMLCVAA